METTTAPKPAKAVRISTIALQRRGFVLDYARAHRKGFTLPAMLKDMVSGGNCPGKCPSSGDWRSLRPATTILVGKLVEEGFLIREGGRGQVTTYRPGPRL